MSHTHAQHAGAIAILRRAHVCGIYDKSAGSHSPWGKHIHHLFRSPMPSIFGAARVRDLVKVCPSQFQVALLEPDAQRKPGKGIQPGTSHPAGWSNGSLFVDHMVRCERRGVAQGKERGQHKDMSHHHESYCNGCFYSRGETTSRTSTGPRAGLDAQASSAQSSSTCRSAHIRLLLERPGGESGMQHGAMQPFIAHAMIDDTTKYSSSRGVCQEAILSDQF